MSQVELYLGKEGLKLSAPLKNFLTSGCFPTGKVSIFKKDDKDDLAVFKALYSTPCLNSLFKNYLGQIIWVWKDMHSPYSNPPPPSLHKRG